MAEPAPRFDRSKRAPLFLVSAMRRLTVLGGIGLSLVVGGCVTDRSDVTGSIAPVAAPRSDVDRRAFAATWGERYRAKPDDKTAALNYARGLRALTQYAQAEAVLETAAIKSPYDTEILGAYGKALADSGKFKEASEVLGRAQSPENPDWNILSAQGTVADQMGDHTQAQALYITALKIKPNDPGVMSNLGLSYALSSKLPIAEQTIRQASENPSADVRVRQNLALVLALEGKFGEAEQVAQVDLSPTDATANVASIRTMIAQSNTWSQIQRTGSSGTARRNAARPRRLQAALQSE